MEKIINSLLYGSRKTKSYLWTIIALGVAAIGCIAGAVISSSLFPLAGTLAFSVLGVVIFQSVSFQEVIKEGGEIVEKGNKSPGGERKQGKRRIKELLEEEEASEILEEGKGKEKKENDKEREKETVFKDYSEKEMQKLMFTYKVKKQHKKVIIDFSSRFRIRQCPAFMWKEKNEVLFLLLEEEPRIIRIPLEKITEIGYRKMAQARPDSDYEGFKESGLIPKMFSEYLPQYVGGGQQAERFKNLYVIYPDIQLTNRSARNAFDILEVDFDVEDKFTMSPVYEDYFKMAYKAHILWMDEVISTNEYKQKIKVLLNGLLSENLSKELFEKVLQQLVAHKLITQEYAKHYRELRK